VTAPPLGLMHFAKNETNFALRTTLRGQLFFSPASYIAKPQNDSGPGLQFLCVVCLRTKLHFFLLPQLILIDYMFLKKQVFPPARRIKFHKWIYIAFLL